MKWTLLVTVVVTCLGLCSAQIDCFGEGLPSSPRTTAVTKGADNFSLTLFKDIAIAYPRNSIVLSPYSVWSVLNLAYFGSKGNTEAQLKTALGVPTKSDAYYGGLIIESSLRLNEGTTFNKADKAYFADDITLRDCAIQKLTQLERVNFRNPAEAAQKINNDVSITTDGKIPKFLSPSVIRGARFILLNAVYFKGNWTHPFAKTRTAEKPFYNDGRKTEIAKAKMMSGEATLRITDSSVLQASVLELPYENSNIAMFLILPHVTRDAKNNVNDVISRITSDVLDDVTRKFQLKSTVVTMPRFKLTTRVADELKKGLRNLGVTDLFDPAKADLSNFVPDERVVVEESLHHATIEVSEEGTVAAAATALIGTRSGASDIEIFNADRPFVFLIRDVKQGITLFMGVYRDPRHTAAF